MSKSQKKQLAKNYFELFSILLFINGIIAIVLGSLNLGVFLMMAFAILFYIFGFESKILNTNTYLYREANMLSHIMSINAIKKVKDINLKYHRAFKKNAFVNFEGVTCIIKSVPSIASLCDVVQNILSGISAFGKNLHFLSLFIMSHSSCENDHIFTLCPCLAK